MDKASLTVNTAPHLNVFNHKPTQTDMLHTGSYCDAEQGGPDSGPSVQSSVDDQDKTHS